MNITSSHAALNAAFHWAIQNSLSATVLIALVLIVQFAFRRTLPPRWRYALGLLILLRLALPVAPASSISIFNLAKRSEPPPVIRPMAQATVMPEAVPVPAITLAPGDYQTVASAAVLSQFEMEPVRPRINWGFLAELVWLVGCIALLVAAIWRHRRFAVALRRWGAVAEPRALALLEECRARLNVKRNIQLLSAEGLSTPALFGHWQPALLIPGEMLRRLGDRELRHIMLHELVHLKRGDILVNWAMIFVRALHWFNPAVWFAFRRLRADQELACDADVMTLLDAGERRDYGGTLIKVLEDFSASGLCPGLVPFVTRKPVIQRRITMIAQYKPAGRLVAAASFALLVALGCVTFTRAAGKQANTSSISPSSAVEENPSMMPTPGVPVPVSATPMPSTTSAETAAFEAQMKKIEDDIHDKQMKLYELRLRLGITSSTTEGTMTPQDSDSIAELNRLRRSAENEMIKTETQVKVLKNLDRSRLRSTIPFLEPDPVLNSLLQDLAATETRLISLRTTVGAEHPDVKNTEGVRDELNKQIDGHVNGVFAAMQVRIDTLKAQSLAAQEQIDRLRKENIDQAREYRPYWELKTEIDRLERLRDLIIHRAAQEKADPQVSAPISALPRNPTASEYAPDVPSEMLRQYYDVRNELDSNRRQQRFLRSLPSTGPQVEDLQRKIDEAEARVKQFEKMYPALQSIPSAEISRSSSVDVLVVDIQRGGTLRIDGSKVTIEAGELMLAIQKNHPAAIEIRADPSVPFEMIVKVMDAARNGGVPSVSVHTTRQ